MNALAVAFLLIAAIGLIALPRRWAALALLAGSVHLPVDLSLALGPFNFYAMRLLLAIGVLRVMMRGEALAYRINGLDTMMAVWSAAALATSLLHEDVVATLINRSGMVYTCALTYFLFRVFCQSRDEALDLCRITAWVLMPLAVAIAYEKRTGLNPFAVFGGSTLLSEIRDQTVRAQGPFAHSILCGFVGATTLPLMAALWKPHRKTAIAGAVAALTLVLASGSSGPFLGAIYATGALLFWHWRQHLRLLRWLVVLAYVALDIVMKAPAYYLLARIDLTGSSTSWHRAALIEAAIDHLPQWWLAGTNHTRSWLPYGVAWSDQHADITNHYIRMGVDGGLPLMLSFIAVLVLAFATVGRSLRQAETPGAAPPFLIWALGAALFTHATAFLGVSYFDQSVVFLYMTLAAIGSLAPQAARQHVNSVRPLRIRTAPTAAHAPTRSVLR